MSADIVEASGRLRGRAVFLSASTPSPDRAHIFRRIPDAQREIERAVTCLARAVFAAGGRLVFGGHPSIAPLVALVASEYATPGVEREPLATVHQLDIFKARGEIPDATMTMERLGHARIVWYDTDASERDVEWSKAEEKYPISMARMRISMIRDSSIAAMVCIGGMEGVLKEVAIFAGEAQHNADADPKPIFVLEGTGGASALLARGPQAEVSVPPVQVDVLDAAFKDAPALPLIGPDGTLRDVGLKYRPYSLLMQEMIKRLG